MSSCWLLPSSSKSVKASPDFTIFFRSLGNQAHRYRTSRIVKGLSELEWARVRFVPMIPALLTSFRYCIKVKLLIIFTLFGNVGYNNCLCRSAKIGLTNKVVKVSTGTYCAFCFHPFSDSNCSVTKSGDVYHPSCVGNVT